MVMQTSFSQIETETRPFVIECAIVFFLDLAKLFWPDINLLFLFHLQVSIPYSTYNMYSYIPQNA